MKIFMTDMHSRIVSSFGNAFASFGATLYLAGHTFNPGNSAGPFIHYGRKWSQKEIDREIGLSNVKAMEIEELLDNPPDVFMIMCAEQQNDQLILWKLLKDKDVKLAWYSGNDSTGLYYHQGLCQNLLAADVSSYVRFKTDGKHCLYYYPWIDYDAYPYAGPCDEPIVRSYINSYERLFPGGYNISKAVMETVPDLSWEVIDGRPVQDIPALMENSMATLHNKDLEGYGYAIIESLAVGRPVIIFKPFSANRSYQQWCIEGESALYFNDHVEFQTKVRRLLDDEEYRHALQESAAKTVRRIIDNDEQNQNLKKFMESLV